MNKYITKCIYILFLYIHMINNMTDNSEVQLEEEYNYEVFDDKTTKEVFEAFVELYETAKNNKFGKLSDLQRAVLTGVANGYSYSRLQKILEKKHIASIQSSLSGGINNLLNGIVDMVWLYNNKQLMDWLKENLEKRF